MSASASSSDAMETLERGLLKMSLGHADVVNAPGDSPAVSKQLLMKSDKIVDVAPSEVLPSTGVHAPVVETKPSSFLSISESRPLRPYQARIVKRLAKLAARAETDDTAASTVLVYLPTGGGKTRIAVEVCRRGIEAGKRCVFIVNRNKLADQASASAHRCMPQFIDAASISCTGVRSDGCCRASWQCGSIQGWVHR